MSACRRHACNTGLPVSLDGWRVPQDVTDTLKKDREGRGRRRWRSAFRRIQQQLLDLETDSRALELVYPQVRSLPVLVRPAFSRQLEAAAAMTLAAASHNACATYSSCFCTQEKLHEGPNNGPWHDSLYFLHSVSSPGDE